MPMAWGWLLFECDELQHASGYSIAEECQRMRAIWSYYRERHPGQKLHIIRYNSHNYKENGAVRKPTEAERKASIKQSLNYIPEAEFVITYLFYRCAGDQPAITLEPEYCPTLKEYVRTAHKRDSSDPL